ncbi:MAG: hypothetical protein QG639_85 [Patescibacteria group bacterium]|nr:hypothetical protein [Patescibacteria group bacterium]
MIKKLVTSILVFSLFFVLSSSVSFAKCGDWGTVGKCGTYGGDCSASQVCTRLGNFQYECQDSPICANSDHSENICGRPITNNQCGPSNGCKEGFMCSNDSGDNARCVTPTSDDPSCASTAPPAEEEPEESEPPAGVTCANGGNLTANRCGANGGCPNAIDMCMAGQCIPTESCANVEEPTEQPTDRCGANNTVGRCNAGGLCPQGQRCQVGGEDGYECVVAAECSVTPPGETPEEPSTPVGGGEEVDEETGPEIDIFDGPNSDNFKALNPLEMFGNEEGKKLTSPGAIVSRMLLFAFPLAGLILFVMIVWGGFEMLTGATGKGIEAGRQRVTSAIVGFVLLFVAYWVFQIVEVIFGVVIL